MRKMFITLAATSALALGACQSPAADKVEDQAEAKAFIDWALSKKTQDLLVERMGRRPVRTDGKTPPGLPPLSKIKLVPYDFTGAAAKRAENVKRWTERVAQLGL